MVMYLGGGYKAWITQGTPGYSLGVGGAWAGALCRLLGGKWSAELTIPWTVFLIKGV